MKTVTQSDMVMQWQDVDLTIQGLFGQRCESLARQTQFVRRHSQLTGKLFAQTLIFGWMSKPEASYTTLQQLLASQDCHVSSQALEKRMKPQAVAFLHALQQELLGMCVEHEGVMTELLQRFEGVYLQDGTIISLPEPLKEYYQGCGGGRKDDDHEYGGGESALRIQVRLNVTTGSLQGPWLQASREEENQGEGSMQQSPLPARSLYVTDSKYVNVKAIKEHQERETFFLTHGRADLVLTDGRGVKASLSTFLQARASQEVIDEWVNLGANPNNVCSVRIMAFHVSEQTAQRLRCQAHQHSQTRPKGSRCNVRVGKKHARASNDGRHRRKMSQKRFELADWTIIISNVPKQLLAAHEARVLMRARWQIELLWRLWKERGQIDIWRSEKPMRILCEVYAKLIGCIIQHWIILKGCWHHPDRSMVKASQAVQAMALTYLVSLSGPITSQRVLEMMGMMMQRSRLNRRSARYSTADLLDDPRKALS